MSGGAVRLALAGGVLMPALWRRLQHIYAEDMPVIPLYFRAEPYIYPKWLKGVAPTGHQVTTTNWIENWRVAP